MHDLLRALLYMDQRTIQITHLTVGAALLGLSLICPKEARMSLRWVGGALVVLGAAGLLVLAV